jgi:DNA-binding PadR family transcriptional regulator
MHPYRMQQMIKERGKDEVINVRHRASIYQTIDRLQRNGAISVKGKKQNEGKPDLTVYEITAEGREAAYRWIKEILSSPKQEFLEFPAAVSFLVLLTPEEVTQQFTERLAALEGILARIREQFQQAEEMDLPRLFLLETEYERAVVVAELEWVRSVIRDIESKKLYWDHDWLLNVKERLSE